MKLWWLYALLGAVAGGAMPVLVKRGLELPGGKSIDSNLATAVRIVMLIAPVWLLVVWQKNTGQISQFSARNWFFLAVSALATGASWLFSFKALQYAPASRVMPIDKFSLAVTIILAAAFLGETITWRLGLGVLLILAGTLLTIDAGRRSAAKAAAVQPIEPFAQVALSAAPITAASPLVRPNAAPQSDAPLRRPPSIP
jgi:transporter family protein